MQSKSGSDLKVSEEVRQEIASYRARMCTVDDIRSFSRSGRIIAVGDVTTKTLHDAGIPLFLEVVDLMTQRGGEGSFEHVDGSIPVNNPAATLSSELFSAIEECMSSEGGKRIEVRGEEDLAVIPIIFYSVLNTVVVYGVPNKGMACISVTGESKDYVKNLIERMEKE